MKIKYLAILLIVPTLLGCENPKGISDVDYEKYKKLGAPKILYSCTHYTEKINLVFGECIGKFSSPECQDLEELVIKDAFVAYTAGVGYGSTYNSLLIKAEKDCSAENDKFEILESKE